MNIRDNFISYIINLKNKYKDLIYLNITNLNNLVNDLIKDIQTNNIIIDNSQKENRDQFIEILQSLPSIAQNNYNELLEVIENITLNSSQFNQLIQYYNDSNLEFEFQNIIENVESFTYLNRSNLEYEIEDYLLLYDLEKQIYDSKILLINDFIESFQTLKENYILKINTQLKENLSFDNIKQIVTNLKEEIITYYKQNNFEILLQNYNILLNNITIKFMDELIRKLEAHRPYYLYYPSAMINKLDLILKNFQAISLLHKINEIGENYINYTYLESYFQILNYVKNKFTEEEYKEFKNFFEIYLVFIQEEDFFSLKNSIQLIENQFIEIMYFNKLNIDEIFIKFPYYNIKDITLYNYLTGKIIKYIDNIFKNITI